MGLVLFDSHKDVVSGKNFGFWQYFAISGGRLGQKWIKTINFGSVLFPLKHLILKIVRRMSLFYERRTSGQNFNKLESYLLEKKPKNPPIRGHFMDAASPQKRLKILT